MPRTTDDLYSMAPSMVSTSPAVVRALENFRDLLVDEPSDRVSNVIFDLVFEGIAPGEVEEVMDWLERYGALVRVGASDAGYAGSVWRVAHDQLNRLLGSANVIEGV